MKTIIIASPQIWTRRVVTAVFVVAVFSTGWMTHQLWAELTRIERVYQLEARI